MTKRNLQQTAYKICFIKKIYLEASIAYKFYIDTKMPLDILQKSENIEHRAEVIVEFLENEVDLIFPSEERNILLSLFCFFISVMDIYDLTYPSYLDLNSDTQIRLLEFKNNEDHFLDAIYRLNSLLFEMYDLISDPKSNFIIAKIACFNMNIFLHCQNFASLLFLLQKFEEETLTQLFF